MRQSHLTAARRVQAGAKESRWSVDTFAMEGDDERHARRVLLGFRLGLYSVLGLLLAVTLLYARAGDPGALAEQPAWVPPERPCKAAVEVNFPPRSVNSMSRYAPYQDAEGWLPTKC